MNLIVQLCFLSSDKEMNTSAAFGPTVFVPDIRLDCLAFHVDNFLSVDRDSFRCAYDFQYLDFTGATLPTCCITPFSLCWNQDANNYVIAAFLPAFKLSCFWDNHRLSIKLVGYILRAGQVRAGQVRAGQVRAAQLRAAQIRATQVRATQVRATQVRATQVRAGQVRATQVRAGQVRATQVRAGQVRAGFYSCLNQCGKTLSIILIDNAASKPIL